jgi:hypothetical protein
VKFTFNKLVIVLAGGLALSDVTARANFEVSAGVNIQATADFNAPLASEGAWVEVGTYGRCWHPNGVGVGWRPYCSGEWVWTDCGWYWQSDEPWAWACYHYGSWVLEPSVGWVWVPGIEWAPAWVCWRTGPGYIGWAPLGPRTYIYGGPQFVFVENARFGGPIRPNTVIINNTTIINNTKVVNNIRQQTKVVGGTKRTVVVNEGPGLAAVQKASGKSFQNVPIQEAAARTRFPANFAHQVDHRDNVKPATQAEVKSKETAPSKPTFQNEPKAVQTHTVAQEPAKNTVPATATTPSSTVHQPRPGENREPTTRWWNPFSRRTPQKTPTTPTPKVTPSATPAAPERSPAVAPPKGPENPGAAPREPEHNEGHGEGHGPDGHGPK